MPEITLDEAIDIAFNEGARQDSYEECRKAFLSSLAARGYALAAVKAQGCILLDSDDGAYHAPSYERGRADALEEAAKVIEKNMVFAPKHIGPDHGKHHEAGAQHAQRVFAAAIRALKEK